MRSAAAAAAAPPSAMASPRTVSSRRSLPGAFRRRILVATAIALLPAAGILATGRVRLAGLVFWGSFAVVVGALLIRRGAEELAALALALAPPINLLRDLAFYNVVVAVGAGALAYVAFLHKREMAAHLRGNGPARALLIVGTFYYALSLLFTGDYSVNIRVFELIAAALLTLFLTGRQGRLPAALLALVGSSAVTAAVMIPLLRAETAERLGQIRVDGVHLGNPVQIGMPLALGLLLAVADRGAWLGLSRRASVRVGLAGFLSLLLLLTTSRAAWLVAAGGVAIVLLVGRRGRLQMMLLLALGLTIALVILPRTPFGEFVEKGFTRTFDEERTARNRTSGRSDQWIVAASAMLASPVAMLVGHGPGTGADVYALESTRTLGVEYAVGHHVPFHSLYMQLGVETGLVGLVPVLLWLSIVLKRAASARKPLGALPLVGAAGWALIALTVSANDTVSGVFLGLGLIASTRPAPAKQAR
jgi:O-antigen ligase